MPNHAQTVQPKYGSHRMAYIGYKFVLFTNKKSFAIGTEIDMS